MDTSSIAIPKIIPADKARDILRVYKPDQFVIEINRILESFISSINDVEHLKDNKMNITRYCAGYTLSEIRSLIKELITEYRANGYIIKYSVYYYNPPYSPSEYRIKIKRIRFATPEVSMPDTPPTYQESMKKRHSFFKRLACGLI